MDEWEIRREGWRTVIWVLLKEGTSTKEKNYAIYP